MRARIEAAQKRRSRRRSNCICAWSTLLAGMVVGYLLLRGGPGPVVSMSRAVHLQGGGSASGTALAGGSNITAAGGAVAAAVSNAVADSVKKVSADGVGTLADLAAAAAKAAADGAQRNGKRLYYDKDGKLLGEVLDEPIPPDCHPEWHADYAGTGLAWGLDHKTASAAQCCAACKAKSAEGCNVWAWCGDPSGLCWTPDVWNHTMGSCWLKKQEAWDGNTDLKATNLRVNHRGDFSAEFRKEHKAAPQKVPWVSGVVSTKAT